MVPKTRSFGTKSFIENSSCKKKNLNICLSLPKFTAPPQCTDPHSRGKKIARAATGQILSAAGWSYLPACDGRSWIQRKKQATQCQQWCFFFVSLPSPETNSEFACYKDESQEESKVRGFLWSQNYTIMNQEESLGNWRKTDMLSFSILSGVFFFFWISGLAGLK